MWLNNSKSEVKMALEILILKKEGVYNDFQINRLVSGISEPSRSRIRKELEYMSALELEELYLELIKCTTYFK